MVGDHNVRELAAWFVEEVSAWRGSMLAKLGVSRVRVDMRRRRAGQS